MRHMKNMIFIVLIFLVNDTMAQIHSAQIRTKPNQENIIMYSYAGIEYQVFFYMEDGKTLWETTKVKRMFFSERYVDQVEEERDGRLMLKSKEVEEHYVYKYEDGEWYRQNGDSDQWFEASRPGAQIEKVMKVRAKIRKETKGKVPRCYDTISLHGNETGGLWMANAECPEAEKPKTKTVIEGGSYGGF